MAATRPAGPGSYPWLPALEDAAEGAEFNKLFPNLAQVLQNAGGHDSPRSFAPTISPARRRLLEQAAVQARPAATRQRGGDISSNEEQLLQVLADLLAQEREDIRVETESKLRAAFSAPPGERRTLIEAQRQKWRALEDSVRELSDLVKNPKEDPKLAADDKKRMRDAKAKGALNVLKKAEHMHTRQKVQLLHDIADSYKQHKPIKETGYADSSLQKLGGPTSQPGSPRAQPSALGSPRAGSPRPGVAAAEALRGQQVAKTDYFPEGVTLAFQQANQEEEVEQQEVARKQAEDEYANLKKQVAMASKMKGAAGAQRQKELQQKADEASAKLKEVENRSKVMGQMQNAVLKQQKADLDAEKVRWGSDKDNLIEQMRTQQLEIASMGVQERQRLLRANRDARMENLRQQWWSDADVQRTNAAKHVLVRAARASKVDYDEAAAQYISQSRNASGGARQRIATAVEKANCNRVGELDDDSLAGRRGNSELDKSLDEAVKSVHAYKRDMETLTRELVPGPEGEAILASMASPTRKATAQLQLDDALRTDRDKIAEKKNAAESRLREAELQLDALTADDIAADLSSSWADTVGAMAAEKRTTERKRKDLEERIEKQLAMDSETELRQARAASAAAAQASASSSEAMREERRRQAEENSRRVEAALQEAEQQRLVPVKVKLTGFKMSQIKDRQAFERAFAERVRSTLDLDESQLRVLEISSGTG